MARLADYFVVIGYDHEKDRNGVSCGKTLQRFPEVDWNDTPFIEGIEWFCQPQGWTLSMERQEPRFFASVLTDIDANRHYCACLCFNEAVAITPSKPVDEEEDNVESESGHPSLGGSLGRTMPVQPFTHHSIMYAPKCLVLVSRLDYIDTFRNCLGILYTVFVENIENAPLETLIGNILGCIQVPPPGGPQVRFSIGASDRQALQPPLSASLPVSGTSVSRLFQQLGIKNVLFLFCAVMTEHKLLFHSKSYTRLTEACHALTCLMYPFRYTHVYIPLLPTALVEVLSTPTPFIMGVHSSLKSEITELLDVLVADLDGGSIHVPDGVTLSMLPEPLWSQVHEALSLVLHPELASADFAFPPNSIKPSTPAMLDKEIRAIFLRMFAQLLQGYRSCLTLIRIHTKPVITFHKAAFLGQRNLVDCDFTVKVLDCMFFNTFVAERGPPWRPCDVWDELYCSISDQVASEAQNPALILTHIQDLAQQLNTNESPNSQPYIQKLLRPPDGAFARIHQPVFPTINAKQVQQIIDEGTMKNNMKARLSAIKPSQPRIVPMGPHISNLQDMRQQLVTNSARRLEVLRNCVSCIFENKISDARKTFPAVLRALKTKQARLALCMELANHVGGNKAKLEHQQFDLVVRLMNCALQDDSAMDEHGVAAALLPLATAFCRKLCTGVIQFAYTCIQDHPVWQNQQFWESAFYQDVQKDIRALYSPRSELTPNGNLFGTDRDSYCSVSSISPISPRDGRAGDGIWSERRAAVMRPQEQSALEIAAEQMRIRGTLDAEKQKELGNSEESTIYSQAIHYANRMVYLLVPVDISKNNQRESNYDDERTSNSVTNSVAESDSNDAESGFEESEQNEVGASVIRFVSRFVDKVCVEGSVTAEHIRLLHQMIPGVVAMHVETLEAVHRESKRLPPVQKPKILMPSLLPGEELILEGLRVYLLPDGRDEWAGGLMGGPVLLPAEGAVFLTNYRIIFKGSPCDPFACEQVVIRCFPLASMTKEKRITVQYVAHLDQLLQEGLQLRSATFQLMKLAFDEEVSSENIEVLRKKINRVRHPQHTLLYFAFNGQVVMSQTPLDKNKEKNATLRGLAKKTLLRTAKKAGFKGKNSSKRQKYVLPNLVTGKYLNSPRKQGDQSPDQDDDISIEDGDLRHVLNVPTLVPPPQADAKTLERLVERSYYKDWQRLGLGSLVVNNGTLGKQRHEPFRITPINSSYTLCRSYPALIVVPSQVSDDSLRRFSRCYRHSRLPVITWRHPRTKALLLRGASFHGKGVIGMLKSHPHPSVSTSETTALEQEKYLMAVVNATPLAVLRQGSSWAMADSTLSIDSLLMVAAEQPFNNATPEVARRPGNNPFAKAMNTLRSSGGKGPKPFGRWGSLKDRQQGSQSSLTNVHVGYRTSQRLSVDSDSGLDGVHALQKAALYVFGEKAQVKGVKPDATSKMDFIPVEISDVRHTKASFKKLMRACVPSSILQEPEQSFYRSVENSEWLVQLKNVMQLAGAVVDLIDVQGSSVMVCLEDGWDFTAQIVSVAQLCLDPYYRTIEGFRVLIEKEWLAFGHRFAHRSNLSTTSQAAGFTPIFLQFLDIVHQIHLQFPMSFEFNQYYLKFLAYHHVSGRFRTFLFDSELERLELGVMAVEDKRGSLSRHHKGVETGSDDETVFPGGRFAGSSSSMNLGQSIFDYIEKHDMRHASFFNFLYSPDEEHPVLRPYSNISNLEVWDYYLGEDLAYGPSYDMEVIVMDSQQEEEIAAMEGIIQTTNRRAVVSGYNNVDQSLPNACVYLLEQIRHLETELGHLPQKWRVLWEKLELPSVDSLTRQASFTTQMIRSHGRSIHKRSTIEILLKSKIVGATETNQIYSHPHRFEKYNFTTPTYCDLCLNILWGLVKTGMRCVDCGYNCHEKCVEDVPKNCTKYKAIIDGGLTTQTMTKSGDTSSITSSVTTHQASSQQYYDQFSSHVAENRTHEGHLYKRGALLKGWKQRWFVLDSIKHQLRYYDAMEDSHCKGYIDLADVASVTPAIPTQGAPKKTDDKSFFDLRTNRRIYNFCASDGNAAQEWIEKLQACLQ